MYVAWPSIHPSIHPFPHYHHLTNTNAPTNPPTPFALLQQTKNKQLSDLRTDVEEARARVAKLETSIPSPGVSLHCF